MGREGLTSSYSVQRSIFNIVFSRGSLLAFPLTTSVTGSVPFGPVQSRFEITGFAARRHSEWRRLRTSNPGLGCRLGTVARVEFEEAPIISFLSSNTKHPQLTAVAQRPMFKSARKMDTSGIEPDPSRKFSAKVLSERDNQLHHVPLKHILHWGLGRKRRETP